MAKKKSSASRSAGATSKNNVAGKSRAIVELATKAGTYFAKILGSAPEDLIGAAGGDWLRHYRVQNWMALEQKTKEIAKNLGYEATGRKISPKFFIEWSEQASKESDESIQKMWASLLANCLDPKSGPSNEDLFIVDALRRMEPESAKAFEVIYDLSFQPKEHWDAYTFAYLDIFVTEGLSAQAVGNEYEGTEPRLSIRDIHGEHETVQKLDVLGLVSGAAKSPDLVQRGWTGQDERELFVLKPTWLGQKLYSLAVRSARRKMV